MEKSTIAPAHVFALAVLSGMGTAMIMQIALARCGIDVAGVWHSLMSADHAQLRLALAWWATAGAGLIGGFVVAFLMSRFNWLYLRFLRGWFLVVLVAGLAALARDIPRFQDHSIATSVLLSTVILTIGFFMASFGGYFALRR